MQVPVLLHNGAEAAEVRPRQPVLYLMRLDIHELEMQHFQRCTIEIHCARPRNAVQNTKGA